ncbi:MAG: Ig-like domain-containing protein, partial [Deltaproteobacteria bacterium]|nr:Ig-like domain-containing protein [Deltaproteobacteria bacterium]
MDRGGLGADTWDYAWRIAGEGKVGSRLSFSALKLRAGPDFAGYHRDLDLTAGGLALHLGPAFSARVDYHRTRRNLALRAESSLAPLQRSLRVGARWSLPRRWALDLNYMDLHAEDLLEPVDRDYWDRALRLGVGRTGRRYSVRVETRAGHRLDRLVDERATAGVLVLSGSLRPAPALSLNGSVSTYLGEAGSGVPVAAEDAVRLGFSWKVARKLAIDLNARHNWAPSRWDWLDGTIRYDVPGRLAVGGKAGVRYEQLIGRVEVSSLVYVTVPFRVPVRGGTEGTIRGRVFDAEADGQPGLGGVVVTAGGKTAVTRPDGTFTLPSLSPGSHALQVESRGMAWGRVPTRPLPIQVEVGVGRMKRLEVGMATPGRVGGRVFHEEIPTSSLDQAEVVGEGRAREEVGARGLVVELHENGEQFTRVTGADGRFSFGAVRPGTWTLVVHPNGAVGPLEDMEDPERVLVLEPGEHAEVEVRIRPRTREIKMIDSGDLTNGGVAEVEPEAPPIVDAAAVSPIVSPAEPEAPFPSLLTLRARPSNLVLTTGQRTALTAQGSWDDGTASKETDAVTWTSSDPEVAAIDDEGHVSAVAFGLAHIVAEEDGVRSEPVTVEVRSLHADEADFALSSAGRVLARVFLDRDDDGEFSASDRIVPATGISLVSIAQGSVVARGDAPRGLVDFPAVAPGAHVVALDRDGLPEGYVPAGSGQVYVDVTKGEIVRVGIPLDARRTIGGRVFLDANRNGVRDGVDTPAPHTLVSLNDGQQRRTDLDGSFLF